MEAHGQVMVEMDPCDRPIIHMGSIKDRYEALLALPVQDLAQQPAAILSGRRSGAL
jgi:hypothetical protein